MPRQPRLAPSRRPARTLAAPAENPSTSSTRASGRHAESTHLTPLLHGQTPADAAPAPPARGTAQSRSRRQLDVRLSPCSIRS
ncbi:hypothetical protein GT018_28680 [Streptomyces sp. SID4912]|nr:hypothetical protein [Streptomyces sp. SID4925]MYY19533.1 hypothetical protein [Streptomyces sp. SID4912]